MIFAALRWRILRWLRANRSLEGVLFSTIKIILAGLVLLCIFSLIWWLWFYDSGIVILPIQTPTNQGYNGQSLSDLLTHELMRIKEINQYQNLCNILLIEDYAIPDFSRQETTIDYRLSQMGLLGQGSIFLSLGDILCSLKSILPLTKPTAILSGSLQSYGTKVVLVACLTRPKSLITWQISANSNCSQERIPQLIQELAYQIAYNISIRKPGSTNTWQAFAYITQGRGAYQAYQFTGNVSELERAKDMALKAQEWEKNYNGSTKLLTIVSLEYLSKGDYERAAFIIDQAIRLDPKFVLAWNAKGIVHKNQGKYNEAIKAYDEAIRLDPNLAIAWYNKGNALSQQGKYDDAIQSYNTAIKINPQYVKARNNKGIVLKNQGKYDEAIKAYDEVIKLDPKLAMARSNKGVALNDQGKYDEAIKAYDEAIRLDPNLAMAWNNKGIALYNQGKYDEAIKACNESIRLDPSYALAWQNKDAALEALGKTTDGIVLDVKETLTTT